MSFSTPSSSSATVTTDGTTMTGDGSSGNPVAIKALGVGTSQLAAVAVTAAKIAAATITATQLANGAVGTNQLAASSVSPAKLSSDALVAQAQPSSFSTTSSTYVDVTSLTLTVNEACMIIAQVSVVGQAAQTAEQIQMVASAGVLVGGWFNIETGNAATTNDVGSAANGVSPVQSNDLSAALATYMNCAFVGYVSAAATVKVQAKSDGTRTLTINNQSFMVAHS